MTPTRHPDIHRDIHCDSPRDRGRTRDRDLTVVAGLRAWAAGSYPLEAAVELLVRALDGRFAAPGRPWIGTTTSTSAGTGAAGAGAGGLLSRVWLDADALAVDGAGGPYSGGERRLLAVAASLVGGGPVDLLDTVPGLDRHLLDLVLAAVAHAGGSHEHPLMRPLPDLDGALFPVRGKRAGTLHPWPDGPDHDTDRQDRDRGPDGPGDASDVAPGPNGIDGPNGGPVR